MGHIEPHLKESEEGVNGIVGIEQVIVHFLKEEIKLSAWERAMQHRTHSKLWEGLWGDETAPPFAGGAATAAALLLGGEFLFAVLRHSVNIHGIRIALRTQVILLADLHPADHTQRGITEEEYRVRLRRKITTEGDYRVRLQRKMTEGDYGGKLKRQ